MDVELTEEEIPFFVSMMPCTIHGCRPLSVSSQPAVFIANGSTAAQIATHRNRRGRAPFPPPTRHSPPHPTSRAKAPADPHTPTQHASITAFLTELPGP